MAKLQFKPVSRSWVALHPEPQGVIQFVGGAFFGTFGPSLFYRHLLQYFFDKSYTLILLPFNFTFNHYRESFFLLREQYRILPELVRMAIAENYEYQPYLKSKSYYWVGHSIGCKYIALLEAFNALPEDKTGLSQFIRELLTNIPGESYSETTIQRIADELTTLIEDLKQLSIDAERLVKLYIKQADRAQRNVSKAILNDDSESFFTDLFTKNQPSVLLAPCTSDTSSAIQPKALADLINKWGFGVEPTPKVTHELIKKSDLFNLLVLVRFKSDTIALETCQWFIETLGKPPQYNQEPFSGGHLRPLGLPIGNFVFNPFFDQPLLTATLARNKELEARVDQLLEDLLKTMKQVQQ